MVEKLKEYLLPRRSTVKTILPIFDTTKRGTSDTPVFLGSVGRIRYICMLPVADINVGDSTHCRIISEIRTSLLSHYS